MKQKKQLVIEEDPHPTKNLHDEKQFDTGSSDWDGWSGCTAGRKDRTGT
jgi:hypothetical protein